MKRTLVSIIAIALLTGGAGSALAIDAGSKQAWLTAREATREAQAAHRQAKLDYAVDKTPENQQAVVDTGKELLQNALTEAEQWLLWKHTEAQEDPRVPDSIRDGIADDVEANLAKIDGFRDEVDGISNQLELGIVFLKMVGGYLELLADVARNTGAMWVHVGDTLLDDADTYEGQLRDAAETVGSDDALAKLDSARDELDTARSNVRAAESAYGEVVIPGQPLIKFSEGNSYLRTAKLNLASAHGYLLQAFTLINAQ